MCVLCGLGSHCMLFMEMENARRRPVASLSRPSWQLVSSADTLTLQRAPLPGHADVSARAAHTPSGPLLHQQLGLPVCTARLPRRVTRFAPSTPSPGDHHGNLTSRDMPVSARSSSPPALSPPDHQLFARIAPCRNALANKTLRVRPSPSRVLYLRCVCAVAYVAAAA